MQSLPYLFILLFFISCSEQQVFDNTFQLAQKQMFLNHCKNQNKECLEKVVSEFDTCYEQIDWHTQELLNQAKTTFLSDSPNSNYRVSKESTDAMDKLTQCIENNIGHNANYIGDNVVISKPSINRDNFSGVLIAIKADGKIFFNKDLIELKSLQKIAKKYKSEHQDKTLHVVILTDKYSRTGDLVAAMDAIKAAGLGKISLATTRK